MRGVGKGVARGFPLSKLWFDAENERKDDVSESYDTGGAMGCEYS